MKQQVESGLVRFDGRPLGGAHYAASDSLGPYAAGGGMAPRLLLASVGDHGYVIPSRRTLSAGLAASALVELALHGRISADGRRLLVTSAAPTDDPVVDPVLDLLAARRRAPEIDRCLEELALDWTILGRAGDVLERLGLVEIERRALHPLVMHRFHPVPPNGPEQSRAWLRSVLEGVAATPPDAALAALAGAARVLGAGPRRDDHSAGVDSACRALSAAAAAVLPLVHEALAAATDGRREAQPASA